MKYFCLLTLLAGFALAQVPQYPAAVPTLSELDRWINEQETDRVQQDRRLAEKRAQDARKTLLWDAADEFVLAFSRWQEDQQVGRLDAQQRHVKAVIKAWNKLYSTEGFYSHQEKQ